MTTTNIQLLRQQPLPGAAEPLSQPHRSRHEYVGLPGFDLLERPDVQVGQLCQSLLRHLTRDALPTEIGSEGLKLANRAFTGHAPSCRNVRKV